MNRAARRLAAALLALAAAGLLLGLLTGSDGLRWPGGQDAALDALLIGQIRAPRGLGAWLAGALLGLAGALAQGLFRNPLADPYLLGSAAGAGLGVVLVLASGSLLGHALPLGHWADLGSWLLQLGLVGAAFAGALLGVLLTLLLAGGAAQPLKLLLCGVVVGVLLGALSDLLLLLAPEALRGRQVFMLGTTGLLGWPSVLLLAGALGLCWPLAQRGARLLDALVLGEASARSLGLALPRLRLGLVLLLALATGCAVSQAGLVAFVGLLAPHLVRQRVLVAHGALLGLSTLAGAALLLWADLASRWLLAPQELPVGVLTAVLGGLYLLWLLRQGRQR